MSNINYRYDAQEFPDDGLLTYVFISEARSNMEDVADIIKIIQYAPVQDFMNKPVYNLGFGDLDMVSGAIIDDSIRDNGDVYCVFNTVLSTIPLFFKRFPGSILLVQGSDSREEFEVGCRPMCRKQCGDENCRNFNRRMKIYSGYVSRKIDVFEESFQFLGGRRNENKWFDLEEFIPGTVYDSIMVFQKNV
jgi:hypothetical protein